MVAVGCILSTEARFSRRSLRSEISSMKEKTGSRDRGTHEKDTFVVNPAKLTIGHGFVEVPDGRQTGWAILIMECIPAFLG
jgi:hypothetical protein